MAKKYPGKKAGWGKDVGKKQGLTPPQCGPNKPSGDHGFMARPFHGDKGRLVGLKPTPDQGFGGKVTDEHMARPWGGDEGKLTGLTPDPIGHGHVSDKGPKD